jgi:hypothetical protein
MGEYGFKLIRGEVSSLQVRQDKEDFVFTAIDKTAGGVAAAGLAIGALAGAATGALLSAEDTEERVDFFVCMVAGQRTCGRFGKVTFSDGDVVEVVGSPGEECFHAYAVVRPADRTVWMYPHCGRGTTAYKRYSTVAILLLSVLGPAFIFGLLDLVGSDNPFDFAFWLESTAICALVSAAVLAFTSSRFTKFARLSNDIFTTLRFDKPDEVDLHKRLREASKSLPSSERVNYHPHARWVYKY